MSKQIVTVIVEDAPIVDKLQSSRTIVEKIVVGTQNQPITVPVDWSSSETILVNNNNQSITGSVVNDPTLVEKVTVGVPVRIGDTKQFSLLDSTFVTGIVDSAYVNALVDISLIDSTGGASPAFNPLVWDSGGELYGGPNYRYIRGFRPDPNFPDEEVAVRDAEFIPAVGEEFSKFRLLLATFTPTIGTGSPQTINLNWDDLVTSFSISVSNPIDFVSRYVNEVLSLEASPSTTDTQVPMSTDPEASSIEMAIEKFNSAGPVPVPFGGSTWTQSWSTDADWYLSTEPRRGDKSYVTDFYSRRDVFISTGGSEEIGGGSYAATAAGNASIWVRLADTTGTEYGGRGAPFDNATRINFVWRQATINVSVNNVSGRNFLKTYTSTTYTTSVSNLTNISNARGSVYSGDADVPAHIPNTNPPAFVVALGEFNNSYTGPFGGGFNSERWPDAWLTGGTLTNYALGSGTWTFDIPVHKNDHPRNSSGPSVNFRHLYASARFTRPPGIAGSFAGDSAGGLDPAKGASYTERTWDAYNSFSASWVYNSFYLFTPSLLSPPINSDVVDGDEYASDVAELGNVARTLNGFITNSSASPRAFWFGIRASATQPSFFRTGSSASLLSDVTVTTSSVALEPIPLPDANYVAENFTIYGFVLQPGTTYVSIG